MSNESTLKEISANRMFKGWHKRYSHYSSANQCEMTFAIYLPDTYSGNKMPVLYWLSGLTCTDENFSHKAGAQRVASELGIVLVIPDTSPRGEGVPDDPDGAYDFGLGAGFYLNATQEPWSKNYNMYDYIVTELPGLIEASFPVSDKRSISGHSMGGHGALTIALKNTARYRSVSAFSPIVNPCDCPWGQKAFTHYLGENQEIWKEYDTCELLLKQGTDQVLPMLIDQGKSDNFIQDQLKPMNFMRAVKIVNYPAEMRLQDDFDHSYYFIATFIEEHLHFHAGFLAK